MYFCIAEKFFKSTLYFCPFKKYKTIYEKGQNTQKQGRNAAAGYMQTDDRC